MDKHDDTQDVRRDKVYTDINEIVDRLNNLNVFPSLVWVYAWDIVRNQLDYYHFDSGEDYVTNDKLTEKDVWNMFWNDADKNGFTLEYGASDLHDGVFDWMIDSDIIISSEDQDDEEDEDDLPDMENSILIN
jgi:hypothetical protein